MAVLINKRNRSVTHKLKRAIAFSGWRRNIGAKEKITAKELRSKHILTRTAGTRVVGEIKSCGEIFLF